MLKNRNICKFVTTTNEKQIFITNFVLEHELEHLQGMHHVGDYSVRLVLSGKGKVTIGNQCARLRAGTIFFLLPQVEYRFDVDDKFTCMYITFYGQRAQELLQRFRISEENCVFDGNEGLIAFWQNCLGKANESNLELMSESVLLYTFAQMSSPIVSGKRRLLDGVLDYVEQNFKKPELNLTTIADELGYNPKYISRAFREGVGISFTEYVKNMRIQYAVFLIENGITTVKNLAILCGFTDPYYFSNVFKEIVGVSPSKYIENKSQKGEE